MIMASEQFIELCGLCNKNPAEGTLTVEGDETWEGLEDQDGFMRWQVCKPCVEKIPNEDWK